MVTVTSARLHNGTGGWAADLHTVFSTFRAIPSADCPVAALMAWQWFSMTQEEAHTGLGSCQEFWRGDLIGKQVETGMTRGRKRRWQVTSVFTLLVSPFWPTSCMTAGHSFYQLLPLSFKRFEQFQGWQVSILRVTQDPLDPPCPPWLL